MGGRGVPAEPSVSTTAHPEDSPYLAAKDKAVHAAALAPAEHPQTAAEFTKQFSRAKEAGGQEVLDTVCALGRVRPGDTPAPRCGRRVLPAGAGPRSQAGRPGRLRLRIEVRVPAQCQQKEKTRPEPTA